MDKAKTSGFRQNNDDGGRHCHDPAGDRTKVRLQPTVGGGTP